MQTDGAARRAGTRPKRGRLSVLLATAAVVVIATVALLVMWAPPLARSGAGAQDADPSAGAGSAVIHDDAGAVHPYTPEEVDPWVNNLRGR